MWGRRSGDSLEQGLVFIKEKGGKGKKKKN